MMGLESINKDDLCVCAGCCCCNQLMYRYFPNCVGCSSQYECLCIGEEFCFSPYHPPLLCERKDGQICQIGLYLCSIYLKTPTICCKGGGHCCCSMGECSFPPEPHMPFLVAAYGLMCFPKIGCCVKWSEVKK